MWKRLNDLLKKQAKGGKMYRPKDWEKSVPGFHKDESHREVYEAGADAYAKGLKAEGQYILDAFGYDTRHGADRTPGWLVFIPEEVE